MPRTSRSSLFTLLPIAMVLSTFFFLANAQDAGRSGGALSREDVVALAERYIRENGYTDAPESELKAELDPETIEWSDSREAQLKGRRNTLRAKAIGVKSTREGWGVAFDYVSQSETCRVVTLSPDGSGIRVQHDDGIREFWVGFGDR